MSAECASNEDLQFENAKVGEKMWVGDQTKPGAQGSCENVEDHSFSRGPRRMGLLHPLLAKEHPASHRPRGLERRTHPLQHCS